MADPVRRVAADNRRARHDYFIDDHFEAGLMLQGTEVKSLRTGKANLSDAYAGEQRGELFLFNAYIPEYSGGNRFNHEPRRARKLLLHKREIDKLLSHVKRGGMTLIPLSIYFNEKGRAKVDLALARGKKHHDKRASEKERDWKREQGRIMRDRG